MWEDLSDVPQHWAGCVITIGVFDGFHRGHQALVRRARTRARRLGVPLVLMTFDPHPRSVTKPGSTPALLLSVAEPVAMAHALGVDVVLVLPFTHSIASIPADEFVGQALIASLKAKAVVIGANFRFGAGGRGDISMSRTSAVEGGSSTSKSWPPSRPRGVPAPSTRCGDASRRVTLAAPRRSRSPPPSCSARPPHHGQPCLTFAATHLAGSPVRVTY